MKAFLFSRLKIWAGLVAVAVVTAAIKATEDYFGVDLAAGHELALQLLVGFGAAERTPNL